MSSECNGPSLYSEIARKPTDSTTNDTELIKSYLNRNPRNSSISKNASLKGSLTPNRSSSTNLSVNNMKVPLLVNSTGKSPAARQLPVRSSRSPDTLSRTSDTFKGQPEAGGNGGGRPGTFSSLSTLKKPTTSLSSACKPTVSDKPTASRKKFYYDSQGHRIQVRSTIEDFLKREDEEECKPAPDDDNRSYSSCSLRDSSLNIQQSWAKLPFY